MVAETEKITVNLSVVDLGKMDLLSEEGLYTGRTDFVRTAIRNLLDKHTAELSPAIARSSAVVGVLTHDAASLRRASAHAAPLHLVVVGVLAIAADVTPQLAVEVIKSVKVLGAFRAPDGIKEALRASGAYGG